MNPEIDFLNYFPDESLSVIQSLNHPLLTEKGARLDVKREDLIHPYISGNKWRKLKYNLREAKKTGKRTLLTFGGAHSNHIYATAAAGKLYGYATIGIIRGEELLPDNETLTFALRCGMQLKFVSREVYKQKKEQEFISALREEFGDFYLIPEGGTNDLAIQGCEEILAIEQYKEYDFIALMVGTGGSFSGILNASQNRSQILGISALKGEFMKNEIALLDSQFGLKGNQNYSIFTQYHHGGYGKTSEPLQSFIDKFILRTGIPIEFVYTGKLFYALFDLIEKDFFKPKSRILAIHSGGLRA